MRCRIDAIEQLVNCATSVYDVTSAWDCVATRYAMATCTTSMIIVKSNDFRASRGIESRLVSGSINIGGFDVCSDRLLHEPRYGLRMGDEFNSMISES